MSAIRGPDDASSIRTILPLYTCQSQQMNRPPSLAPTYHTVDKGVKRSSSPTPTYDTDGRQQLNLAPSSTSRDGQNAKSKAWLLLGKGADVVRKGTSRRTALRSAAVHRRGTMVILQVGEEHKAEVLLLLENGFDITVKNFDKAKALSWAAFSGHEAMVQFLQKTGRHLGIDIAPNDKTPFEVPGPISHNYKQLGKSPSASTCSSIKDKDILAILKPPYQRPKLDRVFCERCTEFPEGFRGQHELACHQQRQHKPQEKKWICVEPADGIIIY
jgi:hypothetical protein